MNESPFPGMDPYLECHWRDTHASLVIYASDQLRPLLPAGLRACAAERIFVESDRILFRKRRLNNSESFVSQFSPSPEANAVSVLIRGSAVTEIFLQIIDARAGNRVVTIIEFISPTNKRPGPGRDEYLKKREEWRQAGVNLVEIDLTLDGSRASLFPLAAMPHRSHTAAYFAAVSRATKPHEFVYPIPLQRRLPSIVIPLRADDDDVALDLQPLIEQAYDGYDFLDYAQPPPVPLGEADEKWADSLLRAAGKRS